MRIDRTQCFQQTTTAHFLIQFGCLLDSARIGTARGTPSLSPLFAINNGAFGLTTYKSNRFTVRGLLLQRAPFTMAGERCLCVLPNQSLGFCNREFAMQTLDARRRSSSNANFRCYPARVFGVRRAACCDHAEPIALFCSAASLEECCCEQSKRFQ